MEGDWSKTIGGQVAPTSTMASKAGHHVGLTCLPPTMPRHAWVIPGGRPRYYRLPCSEITLESRTTWPSLVMAMPGRGYLLDGVRGGWLWILREGREDMRKERRDEEGDNKFGH